MKTSQDLESPADVGGGRGSGNLSGSLLAKEKVVC